jgi:hypothetical protein
MFCTPAAGSFVTLPALAMLMIALSGRETHVDCWSVSGPAAPNLASIIKGVSHEFCTPAASSFVHTACWLC